MLHYHVIVEVETTIKLHKQCQQNQNAFPMSLIAHFVWVWTRNKLQNVIDLFFTHKKEGREIFMSKDTDW